MQPSDGRACHFDAKAVFQELENAAFSKERLEPKRIADAMKRKLGEIGLS
jgi:hypothetical protein